MDKLYNAFFSPFHFRRAMPDVWAGFQINIRMMIAAEILVLVLALALAVVRGLPGRAAWPLRALAVGYTDFFRGTPLILVASLLNIGIPLLDVHWPGTHHIEFFRVQPLLAVAGQLGTVAVYLTVGLLLAVHRSGLGAVATRLEETLRTPLVGFGATIVLLLLMAMGLPAVGLSLSGGSSGFRFDVRGAVVAIFLVLLVLIALSVVRGAEKYWRSLFSQRTAITLVVAFAILGAVVLPSAGVGGHHAAGFNIHLYGFTLYPLSKWPLTYYGIAALTIVYTAYVAEVYRAGIQSVHPSQRMAARSLGLSYGQSMRFVILPQAIRRVIPPLLNDFIGLQKDTAIMAFIGLSEGLLQAQQYGSSYFNVTAYAITAVLFVLLTIPLARFTDHIIAERESKERAQLV